MGGIVLQNLLGAASAGIHRIAKATNVPVAAVLQGMWLERASSGRPVANPEAQEALQATLTAHTLGDSAALLEVHSDLEAVPSFDLLGLTTELVVGLYKVFARPPISTTFDSCLTGLARGLGLADVPE